MKIDLAKREHPSGYIAQALNLYSGRFTDAMIVEIGCMRVPLYHAINDGSVCGSCLDGHSTAHFARSGFPFISVDNHEDHCETARRVAPDSVIQMDGIEFLKQNEKQIGLLFLDAWDADLPDSAQKHLEAFLAARDHMPGRSLLLVDDTDVEYNHQAGYFEASEGYGGKGKLLIPAAIENGFSILFTGRQTLMERK